jgi:PAS domain S-box-containing protein
MIQGMPMLPAVIIEFFGAALAIILSFMALGYSRALVKLRPNNFIWGFLFYFCIAMAAFSLSRGVGHMVRIFLVFSNRNDVWEKLSPLSGGFNTMLMISAAAVTIYYHKGLAAYRAIRSEAHKLSETNTKLEATANQLQQLNSHLEDIVAERTRNLSESEKKFRNFFENSKDIIYFCDINGNLTNINPSGRELLGIAGDIAAINFHDLFNNPAERHQYLDDLQTKGFISDLEIECLGKDGQTRQILLTANGIYDAENNLVGCEGIGKDMTRLNIITKQLINHEKMASVGQMAAGVAHEINTPLGIILGYTQLMMDDFAPESEIHNNLTVVERQTKACRRIVADLLKFSRQSESIKTTINVNQIIQEVLSVTEHTLNMHLIKVIRNFDPALPPVFGDAEKLHQVFINLFTNAQFAMPAGGELAISTQIEPGNVLIRVDDTGTGIPDEIKSRVFDPFFTTKEVGKGTGLGLSVTYGIIKEHSGSIVVESPAHDRKLEEEYPGTAFFIRLPIATDNNITCEEN